MTKLFLDTNICVHILRKNEPYLTKVKEIGFENCEISIMTYAELAYGAYCSKDPQRSMLAINTLCGNMRIHSIDQFVEDFAKEKARLRKLGLVIEENVSYHS